MRPLSAALSSLAGLVACAASACDNRQVFHEPEPSWERMLVQKRADPYAPSVVFDDGKVMQKPPAGTVRVDDDSDEPPPPISRALLLVGKDRFEKTCAVCHGVAGDGDSVVATKMELRPPPNLHEDRYVALSRARLFEIVSEGYGLMPSYSDMLARDERWAVAAYVQALQLSRRVHAADLPAPLREQLEREAR